MKLPKFNLVGNEERQHQIIFILGFLVLSAVLILQVIKAHTVQPEVYVMYPIGVTVLFVPSTAIRIIKAWKGHSADKLPDTQTGGPDDNP